MYGKIAAIGDVELVVKMIGVVGRPVPLVHVDLDVQVFIVGQSAAGWRGCR